MTARVRVTAYESMTLHQAAEQARRDGAEGEIDGDNAGKNENRRNEDHHAPTCLRLIIYLASSRASRPRPKRGHFLGITSRSL